MAAPDSLAENLAAVKDRIAAAARRAGRDTAEITLIAVSKTHPVPWVEAAAGLGLGDFGENRVEEAAPKIAAVRAQVRWHMVGHVQSRKAADVIGAGFVLVHSVDSARLAGRLSRSAQENGVTQPVLLECNVSGEASKSGFAAGGPAEWGALAGEIEKIAGLPGIRIEGLMTMAPIAAVPDQARPYFARLRAARDYLRTRASAPAWSQLSMGMSDDFEAGILEGATLVRIGRAIFGERAA